MNQFRSGPTQMGRGEESRWRRSTEPCRLQLCATRRFTKSQLWWTLYVTAALASANWPNKNSKNSCARRPMANRNLELLKVAAKLLGPVLDELVFVGGCATGLLVSDEAAAEVRPTFDVDAI